MNIVTDIMVWTENGKDKAVHDFKDENIEIGTSQYIWVRNNSDADSEFIEFIFSTHKLDLDTNLSTSYQIHTEKNSPFGRGNKYKVKKINWDLKAITFEKA
ncbi:hypothetical protein [Paenibacillus alvei]|uniref:hypothetical protein n=1 Tax=Paenibacillus alvei TaxID=44250 RepID=UPI0018CCBD45|nr:hypothetical protein [Paenibacillus alvei]MBG9737103.1 hypothetical protein [Paenibacillus alvei]MBG9742787.1 hypothetical protein [Paenibacillus alvei]MBG9746196.1 hypothetical protein [Paenibacillus alvei]MCY9579695.1 hypothetical protein [Paenibacillus alvei]MCY9586348.1 hypothetical protein [Paenibacillus alvei]